MSRESRAKSPRICGTPAGIRKRAGELAATGRAPAATAAVGPLFQGTLYLANVVFEGAGGPWSVSQADLEVVQAYLQAISGSVTAYSGQYGPSRLAIGAPLPPMKAPVTGAQYTDHDLQGWVNTLAQANQLSAYSAVLVLNPPGVVNQDAKESGGVGVLGYHGKASIPYSFVNLLGTGLSLSDGPDLFADAVSHEVSEMTVDPNADGSNPEVCDGCGTNCLGASSFRNYFDGQGKYLGTSDSFPPPYAFAFFTSAIVRPSSASACPAPRSACAYPPP